MSTATSIEWTETTWNPTTGCDRISPGCDNCYALRLASRLKAMGQPKYQADGDPRTSGPGFGVTLHPDALLEPLRWRKPRKVFVDSMADLMHARVPTDFIAQVWAVMALTPPHTYQVLTKRPERYQHVLDGPCRCGGGHRPGVDFRRLVQGHARRLARGAGCEVDLTANWPLANVWLGTSVEDQHAARLRIPKLLATPAAVRFLSCEPLLGPIDLGLAVCDGVAEYGHGLSRAIVHTAGCCPAVVGKLDWLIVGGESGPAARPMDLEWARDLLAQCKTAGVAPFVKQLGAVWARTHDADPKGGDPAQWPQDLRVRRYPASGAQP